MGRSRIGAGYVRLTNGIDDKDGNNDEDDESVIDNNEEDKLDAELEKARTTKTSSFCIIGLYLLKNNRNTNTSNNCDKLNYTAKKWSFLRP